MSRGTALSAAAAVAAVVAVAAAATALPPSPPAGVPARPADLPAASPLTACPGPPLLTGSTEDTAVGAVGSGADQAATDEQFGQAATWTAATTWLLGLPVDASGDDPAGQLTVAPLGLEPATSAPTTPPGTEPGNAVVAAVAVPDAGPVGATVAAGFPTTLGGLALAASPDGDLRGLSAAACVEPSTEAWLLGGSTDVGHSARLVLANPGPTAATVDVEVLTETGAVAAPSGRGLVVPAGQRREVLVEGLAPGEPALAAHVRTTGGAISAFLVHTSLRGLVPGGVDVVTPGSGPATRQLLPGVVRTAGTEPTLRLLAPGTEDAVVTWRLIGQGEQVVGQGAVTVPAGSVLDVPLADVPLGAYTAVVESQVPVAASARVLRGTAAGPLETAGPGLDQPTDVAWSTSVRPLGAPGTAPALLPLPTAQGAGGDLTATVLLGAADVDADTVTVTGRPVLSDGSLGAPSQVDVPGGRTTLVPREALAPADALGVVLDAGGGQVAAGLLLETSGGLVSVVGLQAGTAPEAQVALRRAPGGAWY